MLMRHLILLLLLSIAVPSFAQNIDAAEQVSNESEDWIWTQEDVTALNVDRIFIESILFSVLLEATNDSDVWRFHVLHNVLRDAPDQEDLYYSVINREDDKIFLKQIDSSINEENIIFIADLTLNLLYPESEINPTDKSKDFFKIVRRERRLAIKVEK